MKKFIVLTILAMLMASCSEQHLLDDYVFLHRFINLRVTLTDNANDHLVLFGTLDKRRA